jgi:hypothetical protein
MTVPRPLTCRDLVGSERKLAATIHRLGFGRLLFLQIRHGEPLFGPSTTVIRDVKFGAQKVPSEFGDDYLLKQQTTELFEYVRSIGCGAIRVLEIRHGLPFSMEIDVTDAEVGHAVDEAR